jgi:hypothetical protein
MEHKVNHKDIPATVTYFNLVTTKGHFAISTMISEANEVVCVRSWVSHVRWDVYLENYINESTQTWKTALSFLTITSRDTIPYTVIVKR